MSRTKFIHVGTEGLLSIDDVLHDILVKFLIDEAETFDRGGEHSRVQPSWIAAEIEYWRGCAAIPDIAASFDDSWSDDQRRMVAVLTEQACATLIQRPVISPSEMRSWNVLEGIVGIEPRGEEDVPTAAVVEVGRALITLHRRERIEPPAHGEWYYATSGRVPVPRR